MYYFIINVNEDGEISVEKLSKDDLVDRLTPKDGADYGDYGNVEFVKEEELCGRFDPLYWKGNTLIIRGEVVVPFEKKVVKVFDIE